MKKYFLIALLSLSILVPMFGQAQSFGNCDPSKPTDVLCQPTKSGDLESFVKQAMNYVGTIIGLLAIIMLVYAGARLLIANGDDKKISDAKNTITYTIAGFIISVFAYAGIVAIENFIGVRDIDYNGTNTGIVNPLNADSLQGFVEAILRNTIMISGLVALLMIIYNGFRYMTARGDESQVGTAKKGITWSLLGLVIIIFAYVIISALANLIS